MDVLLQGPSHSFLAALQEEADSLRAFRRFPLNLPVNVSHSSAKPSLTVQSPATLANASVSGFCFSSLEEFSLDPLIVMEIELNRQTHRVPAVVRHCDAGKRRGRTFYECGVQYVKSEATLLFLPPIAQYLRQRAFDF